MVERSENSTRVGIPFFEREGQSTLDHTLLNVDQCLNQLAIDADVVVVVNGPETSEGRMPQLTVDQRKYNADIALVQGEQAGLVRTLDRLFTDAAAAGYGKIFITDADIYRFPGAMKAMWDQAHTPMTGAHYSVYPVGLVEQVQPLTPKERFLYQVFEGDKHPDVQQVIAARGDRRQEPRVKGSLMLIDPQWAIGKQGNQVFSSDSSLNRAALPGERYVADDAYFMHMGRVSLTDHLKARVRSLRAADARGELHAFAETQRTFTSDAADSIADELRRDVPNGDTRATFFLLRTALRDRALAECVARIEGNTTGTGGLVYGVEREPDYEHIAVATYAEANDVIADMMNGVDWSAVYDPTNKPPQTTQTDTPRTPIDVSKLMEIPGNKAIVLDSLGITGKTNLLESLERMNAFPRITSRRSLPVAW